MKCLEVYNPIVISNIYDLERMCWSGASQRIAEVLEMDEEKQDAFLQHVIDYGELISEMDTLTTTNINDFIWFECDEFIEELKHNQKINIKKDLENRVDIDYVIERLEDIKKELLKTIETGSYINDSDKSQESEEVTRTKIIIEKITDKGVFDND